MMATNKDGKSEEIRLCILLPSLSNFTCALFEAKYPGMSQKQVADSSYQNSPIPLHKWWLWLEEK
jgi:hypothetical protein